MITDDKLINYYNNNGYCIVNGLIPKSDIDSFLKAIKRDLYGSSIEIPQMDSQKLGIPTINKFGYLQNPIADIHLLSLIDKSLTTCCNLALDILTNRNMIKIINTLTSATSQSLVMSMFFDQNAGTPAHQDCYYLDTLPPRQLIAAWIALEDINDKSGKFYVVKGSNIVHLELNNSEIKNSDLYEIKIKEFLQGVDKNFIIIPELKKGDVLFWNSGTIHGSTKTLDESYSRKSFTCHFVPNHSAYVQNQYKPEVRDITGFIYNATLCRITNSIKADKNRSDLIPRSYNTFDR